MIPIDLQIFGDDENSESSKDSPERKEMLWESRNEATLRTWASEIQISAISHRKKGLQHKKLYAAFKIPTVLIPIVLSGLTQTLVPYPLVSSLLMIASGLFAGISAFYNFGKTSEQNLEYNHKYNKLYNEITKELNKKKMYRMQCDVYLERIFQEYTSLNSSSPL